MNTNSQARKQPASSQDPFLYDTDQLRAVADEGVIKEGLAYFKENRVMDLAWDESRLHALVEGSDPDFPYTTELSYDGDGSLVVSCNCEAAQGSACKHAVAVLYSYAGEVSGGEADLVGAMDTAIEDRVKRGRTEVKVEHLGGEPWFGTWRAASIASTSHTPRSYSVHVRSLHRRSNYCTCPDYAVNQLGTCKHIEAALHAIRKRADYQQIKDQAPPNPFVYLAWDLDDPPQIHLHRCGAPAPDLSRVLDDYFDATGRFKGNLPEDFFRFSDAVYDREDLDLGEDALGYARRLATNAAHKVRAGEIRQRIMESGGRLPGIRARLYPYQVEGVAFLAANGRALLADDMGLGKTLQAIAAAHWMKEQADVQRILVICPASLKHQWAREIERFTGHQAQVIQGPPAARGVQYRREVAFFILNYELVLRDLSVISEVLSPDLLILDEAQRIKNWRTKIASFIKLIPARYAFVLSGTPLQNRLEDLYSLLQVVEPRVLGPLWRYMADFHVTDERGKVLGYRNLSELRRRLAPVMLRRDRHLVRDQLPERIEQQFDVAMTAEQQELHDVALSTAGKLARIAKRRPLTPSEQNRLMASLQQARMACNAAGLVDKETKGSPKLEELASLLEELCLQGGLKAVVFSEWEQMTRMVEERLGKMGIGCVRLHGGVPTAKRGDLMERFREDDAVQVFISTDAGGVGLNLQSASVLANLDMPWNPAVLDQRIARVHRLGQTERVQIILMMAAESYEQRVAGLVQGKRNLFDNVIEPNATEDVVGVSKKLLETLVEDLAGEKPAAEPSEVAAAAEAETAPVSGEAATRPAGESADLAVSETLKRCIEELQEAFGPRIERVLGAGGGLLVVMDRVDAEAEQEAQRLSASVPVALVDPRTLNGLQRLGAGSPLGEMQTLVDGGAKDESSSISPLLVQAREKLKAAEVLIGQQCDSAAVELLASAALAGAASRGGLNQQPTAQEAGVWLYAEALPKGWVTPDQATAIMRAASLVQATSVPDALVQEVLADTAAFLDGLG